MRAIVVLHFGGPEVLRVKDRADPLLAPADALVRVEAIGVGYVDVMARQGSYAAFPHPDFVPGLEIAGTILAVGDSVASQWVGRRVFGMPLHGGGYAELVSLPLANLVALPDAVSARDAVALGMNALVARIGTERVGVNSGERVFVRGAGGGIGMMVVQTCAALGAHVTATTSSQEKAMRLRALGAGDIIGRGTMPVASVGEHDVIVDTICGPDLGSYFRHLKMNGRYLLCGGIEGAPSPDFGMEMLGIFHKSPTLFAFSLNSLGAEQMSKAGTALFADAAQGRITPVIDREMALTDAAAAHEALQSGGVFGKIILHP